MCITVKMDLIQPRTTVLSEPYLSIFCWSSFKKHLQMGKHMRTCLQENLHAVSKRMGKKL